MNTQNAAKGLLRTKSIEDTIQETNDSERSLKRELSALDLTVYGIGVIIGTGIFVLTGTAAKQYAGPAVALSFVAAGIVCALAALCYAEFASTVPVAGSAYTFSYASLGEFPAWLIGWDLILELALGAAVVAVGWSGYIQTLLSDIGIHFPTSIGGGTDNHWGLNLPAALLVLAVTALLVVGVKQSARFTTVIVAVKVAVVLLVIVAGLFFIKGSNYHPFIPPTSKAASTETGGAQPLIQHLGFAPGAFGVMGIFTAAAVVFFAFIGFDVVATAAEEVKKPQRDLPRGILASLAVCTVLYVSVTLVVTGMQKYSLLSEKAPLADAFNATGAHWLSGFISAGAVAGLTSVTLLLLMGQSRVFFAMSRDGLLPQSFSRVHPKFKTPYRSTILLGLVVACFAAVIPLKALAELVNIGTLAAFILVSLGVIILRRTRPDLPRAFRTPAVPYVPIAAILSCLWLMLNLPVNTWIRFGAWMAIGLVVYFGYSRRHATHAVERSSVERNAMERNATERNATAPSD
ncbi:amino acid permease-associated region [Catenulispora acidiphila DSM 44928]|uniref:Amino acid permease-associated region n=1 Tax=Catenulispora acidiphila (strain DSM 44928 / JCM 14897 / NBRC 102108 / NRRL B-24433 / ID139908) TaxID=479433 RepID=C7QHZ8_CATAD|nr:amino acid permease [Catenulispora acidiphila]ACU73043.1 amino acid permease-associated region [Catenulispora acidiphila DSM 44928]